MVQHEENEQITVFKWAAMQQKVYPELALLHHVPNGGQRNKVTAARLKAAGVKSGVPDICLPVPKDEFHGLYIELKYGKNKPSENQKQWIEQLNKQGYKAKVCYGAEEAIAVIKEYLKVEK